MPPIPVQLSTGLLLARPYLNTLGLGIGHTEAENVIVCKQL